MTTSTPLSERDLADLLEDIRVQRRDLRAKEDNGPLPGLEDVWAEGIRDRQAYIDTLAGEFLAGGGSPILLEADYA